MSLVLWCVFVFVQTVKHRDYFLEAPGDDDSSDASHSAPSVLITLLSLGLLVVSLAAVVLLAKTIRSTWLSALPGCRRPSWALSSS